MKTNSFLITYSDGKTQEVQSDCETVEQMANQVFGFTPELMEEYNCKIELMAGVDKDPEALLQEMVKDVVTSNATLEVDNKPAVTKIEGPAPTLEQTANEAPAPKKTTKKA